MRIINLLPNYFILDTYIYHNKYIVTGFCFTIDVELLDAQGHVTRHHLDGTQHEDTSRIG
jgi:hypothetical protein